ncbi:hypothetical protein [uncultured Lacinutrix sp.]|uniref:hypothetical protein n=1 Tax=uncultured Lacinutrix sp. TaxID=574032 RepID=UPI00261488B3|nr:hypothetical protein [uncultured Lacinutrix sp.]
MTKFNLLLIIIFISSSIYSQVEKNVEINIDNLSKKWEMVDLINSKKTAEELDEIKSMLEGTYIEFRNDSTFTFGFVFDLEGHWELKENVIYTKDRRGENKWTIYTLEKEKLIASRNEATQKIIFKSINKI